MTPRDPIQPDTAALSPNDQRLSVRLGDTGIDLAIRRHHFGEHIDRAPDHALLVMGPSSAEDGLPRHEFVITAAAHDIQATDEPFPDSVFHAADRLRHFAAAVLAVVVLAVVALIILA